MLHVGKFCGIEQISCAIACTSSGTHISKFTCAIYHMWEIIVFSLFILLLYIFCKEKFFIEGFFIEYYIEGIYEGTLMQI